MDQRARISQKWEMMLMRGDNMRSSSITEKTCKDYMILAVLGETKLRKYVVNCFPKIAKQEISNEEYWHIF